VIHPLIGHLHDKVQQKARELIARIPEGGYKNAVK